MGEDRSGYVYLLKAHRPFDECYKIGRTKEPAKRLHTFAVKLPYKVERVIVTRVFDMVAEEAALHRKFADKRIDGEWFRLTSLDVATLRAYYLVCEADDLFSRLVRCLGIIAEWSEGKEPNRADYAARYSRITATAGRRLKRRAAAYRELLAAWRESRRPAE